MSREENPKADKKQPPRRQSRVSPESQAGHSVMLERIDGSDDSGIQTGEVAKSESSSRMNLSTLAGVAGALQGIARKRRKTQNRIETKEQALISDSGERIDGSADSGVHTEEDARSETSSRMNLSTVAGVAGAIQGIVRKRRMTQNRIETKEQAAVSDSGERIDGSADSGVQTKKHVSAEQRFLASARRQSTVRGLDQLAKGAKILKERDEVSVKEEDRKLKPTVVISSPEKAERVLEQSRRFALRGIVSRFMESSTSASSADSSILPSTPRNPAEEKKERGK